jgi:hypothetical protein
MLMTEITGRKGTRRAKHTVVILPDNGRDPLPGNERQMVLTGG